MDYQIITWSSVILLLCVIFVLRESNKMRRHTPNQKFFELSDEMDIYDWDED